MSFSGAYGELAARMERDAFAQVCEITLNEAQWLPAEGEALSTAMNLSDRTCSARNRAYDPRITGWQGGLAQKIEIKAAGLVPYRCSVVVADPDGRVRSALVNGNQRHSAAAIYRVIPGSSTAYDRRFTGLLDTWSFSAGQVVLNLKTDERALWSNLPRWPYLRSEWFQMPQDREGEMAAILYGRHDGVGLTDSGEEPHGMLPTVPVWSGIGWFAVCLAPASFIKDVYVDGVLKTEGTDYEKVYGSLAGGKVFTVVEWTTTPPADDAVVTVNAYGYPAATPAVFTGTDCITNPVTQMRHFLVNFAANRSRGYIPGAWDLNDPLIDSTSWDDAATWADARGLEGARFMNDQMTAGNRFREWCESFPQFRPFWNTEGEIELRILSTEWPGYWDGSSAVISREDTLDGSFLYETDASEITRRVTVSYLYDSVGGEYLRTLDVEDLSVEELADIAIDMPWAPARLIA